MTSEWQGEERRSHPRILLSDRGREGGAFVEAAVVDLSRSGALLEVPSVLPAKSRYVLRLLLPDGGSVELAGEVVRSYVHGFDKEPRGTPSVKYRAAIQFVELSHAARSSLESLVKGAPENGRNLS